MPNLNRYWAVSVLRLCVAAWLFVATQHVAIAAESYRLEVSDKLNVRVVEWQAADLAFAEWTAVSGSYLVGPDGTVSFPFAGEIPAAGKTVSELSKDIGEGLRTALGINDVPNVSIEIAAFGPIYVLGDVQEPGDYAYAPGLNVMKAIALAGGQRHGEESATVGGRDLITTLGAYEVMRDDYVRLLVHRARLIAEAAGKTEIVLPAEVEKASTAPALLAAETAEMQAEFDRHDAQLRTFDAQAAILAKTISTLEQKRQTTQGQLDAAQEQLDTVKNLVDQGLAVTNRVVTLQSNVADFQTRMLDIESLQLKAQQDVSNLADQRDKLGSEQFIQNSQALLLLESQVAELELRMATQQRLIADSGAIVDTDAAGPASFSYAYTVLRDGEVLTASPGDVVEPGDVVTATLSVQSSPDAP